MRADALGISNFHSEDVMAFVNGIGRRGPMSVLVDTIRRVRPEPEAKFKIQRKNVTVR